MDTMFPLKVAQDPRKHFRLQKISNSLFFQGSSEKTAFFECLSDLIPYISAQRPNTESMVP